MPLPYMGGEITQKSLEILLAIPKLTRSLCYPLELFRLPKQERDARTAAL
jgi:hypothetical protein